MDLGLRGRHALVFGASRGLGCAIATALAAEGCDLTLVARSKDALETFAAEVEAAHSVSVQTEATDLADRAAVEHLAARIETEWLPDILVNNGGGPPPGGAIDALPEQWRAQFDSMVLAAMAFTKAALPAMRRQGWGRVITVGSSGVLQPIAHLALSNVLRSGLAAWMRTLADEVAAEGVTVNMLLPGRIDTERVTALDKAAAERQGLTPEVVRERALAAIPARRLGTPAEFGAAAAFLASQQAGYVTGTMMRVDGGLVRGL